MEHSVNRRRRPKASMPQRLRAKGVSFVAAAAAGLLSSNGVVALRPNELENSVVAGSGDKASLLEASSASPRLRLEDAPEPDGAQQARYTWTPRGVLLLKAGNEINDFGRPVVGEVVRQHQLQMASEAGLPLDRLVSLSLVQEKGKSARAPSLLALMQAHSQGKNCSNSYTWTEKGVNMVGDVELGDEFNYPVPGAAVDFQQLQLAAHDFDFSGDDLVGMGVFAVRQTTPNKDEKSPAALLQKAAAESEAEVEEKESWGLFGSSKKDDTEKKEESSGWGLFGGKKKTEETQEGEPQKAKGEAHVINEEDGDKAEKKEEPAQQEEKQGYFSSIGSGIKTAFKATANFVSKPFRKSFKRLIEDPCGGRLVPLQKENNGFDLLCEAHFKNIRKHYGYPDDAEKILEDGDINLHTIREKVRKTEEGFHVEQVTEKFLDQFKNMAVAYETHVTEAEPTMLTRVVAMITTDEALWIITDSFFPLDFESIYYFTGQEKTSKKWASAQDEPAKYKTDKDWNDDCANELILSRDQVWVSMDTLRQEMSFLSTMRAVNYGFVAAEERFELMQCQRKSNPGANVPVCSVPACAEGVGCVDFNTMNRKLQSLYDFYCEDGSVKPWEKLDCHGTLQATREGSQIKTKFVFTCMGIVDFYTERSRMSSHSYADTIYNYLTGILKSDGRPKVWRERRSSLLVTDQMCRAWGTALGKQVAQVPDGFEEDDGETGNLSSNFSRRGSGQAASPSPTGEPQGQTRSNARDDEKVGTDSDDLFNARDTGSSRPKSDKKQARSKKGRERSNKPKPTQAAEDDEFFDDVDSLMQLADSHEPEDHSLLQDEAAEGAEGWGGSKGSPTEQCMEQHCQPSPLCGRQGDESCKIELLCDHYFRELRDQFKVPSPESVLSNNGINLIGYKPTEKSKSKGKSGAHMIMTKDKKYFLKTMTSRDWHALRRIVDSYQDYFHANGLDSLIVRIYAVMKCPDGKWWMMFNNWFGLDIPLKYDLKGSSVGRQVNVDENTKLLHDMNWGKSDHMIYSQAQAKLFADDIRKDATFLKSSNLIDYSLLWGQERYTVKRCQKVKPEGHFPAHNGGPSLPPCVAGVCTPNGETCADLARVPTNMEEKWKEVATYFCNTVKDDPKTSKCTATVELQSPENSSMIAKGDAAVVVSCVGIIDILKTWTFRSKAEHFFKMGYVRNVSVQSPETYAKRFYQKMVRKLADDGTQNFVRENRIAVVPTDKLCPKWLQESGAAEEEESLLPPEEEESFVWGDDFLKHYWDNTEDR
eukprot:TRINITY_DN34722_c0_g1_i1.p1 TRINITY_DN34722_c0_g1~~TRINITY_DN34722_c0_g1_i1.p1  ORF type:complete len:1269 (-),score=349.24 TRINITY_DN34722_c0_g1_i1:138-3944(-)